VAHACNPNYSGGRDQEDCSSNKKKITKIGLVEWLKVKAPSSNSSTTHTHKKN
jgi:glutamate formiminotransferase